MTFDRTTDCFEQVTYCVQEFKSTYRDSLVYGRSLGESRLIKIDGMEGPYHLNIVPQEAEQGGGIRLSFSNAEGQSKTLILSEEEWLPRLYDRIDFTDQYHAAIQSGDLMLIEALDKAKATHHDACGNALQELFETHGITVDGDRKADTGALHTTRDIFGSVADAMTPLLKRLRGVGQLGDLPSH